MSRSDFEPDKDALDEEWVRQPELYHSYATQLADARMKLEMRKNKLEVVKAELDKEIREDPSEYGIVKVTEGAIAAIIVVNPRYVKALEKVNDGRHAVDILTAAVNALDHKKKALENLVYLHGQNYFSSPHAKGMSGDEIDRASRKVKAGKRGRITREDLREED